MQVVRFLHLRSQKLLPMIQFLQKSIQRHFEDVSKLYVLLYFKV